MKRGDKDVGQIALFQQLAQFLQQTVEQQTNAHTEAMNAMAKMVRDLQLDVKATAESKFLAKTNFFLQQSRTERFHREYPISRIGKGYRHSRARMGALPSPRLFP